MDDAKRECILIAAVKAFSRLGFRKTSIDEVAAEAGVGKGTIYLAVSSKDELFLQAVEREVRAFLAAGRRHLAADEPVELLAGLLGFEVREARRRPLVHGLYLGQALATVPRAEREVDALEATLRANLEAAVLSAREAGLLRDDLDVPAAARLLQDLEIAALVRAERRRDPEDVLARLDWRRSVTDLVRGLRRPLAPARVA